MPITPHTSAADPANYARFLLALVIVAGLLWGLKWVLQRVAAKQGFLGQGLMAVKKTIHTPRLEIVAQQPLDLKRRLVVARWDNREFLLLLSPEQSLMVGEQIITPQKD